MRNRHAAVLVLCASLLCHAAAAQSRAQTQGTAEAYTAVVNGSEACFFSGRPAEVRVETAMLDEPPTSQTVPVVYEN